MEIKPLRKNDTALEQIGIKGQVLEKKLGKWYYAKLKELLKARNFTDSMLNTVPPFWLSSLLDFYSMGCSCTSIESVLVKLTRQDSVPIFGLETLTEHEASVDKIPISQQLIDLRKAIDNFGSRGQQMRNFVMEYNNGDIVNMYSNSCCDQYGDKTQHTIDVLDKRNKQWIPVMEKAMLQQPTFFAFGCAHLVGGNGVLNLLIKKGYTVTPMMYLKQ